MKTATMPQLDDHLEDDISSEVLAGLSADPKKIPSRFLYDERGSALFEDITKTPEYYLTRVEIDLLRTRAQDITRLIKPKTALVEFGSGASRKAGFILDAMDEPSVYIPIDISRNFLEDSAKKFYGLHPDILVKPLAADFTDVSFLPGNLPECQGYLGFFPGSTIGNFLPLEAQNFLRNAGKLLGANSLFILGTDLKKDTKTMLAAYDDKAGITKSFSLNLLTRINRELNADFDLTKFTHQARYNKELERIEIRIVSLLSQRVRVLDKIFNFSKSEDIHIENTYKYDYQSVQQLAQQSGWQIEKHWQDPKNMVALWLFSRNEAAFAT